MLTQLLAVKSRLALDEFNVQYDAILTTVIKAISARIDKETNRTLARTVDTAYEFPVDETEILVSCYPIKTVTKFELKSREAEGCIEQTGIDFLIRRQSVISLASPIIHHPSSTILLPLARL